jgi:hypothetical protein
MIWRFMKGTRSEATKVPRNKDQQFAYKMPAKSRARVQTFLRQRDIKLVKRGKDTDVLDIAAVAGVLIDIGISAHRAGTKVPLTIAEFKFLTALAIAVATGVSLEVGDDAPWEHIAGLINNMLMSRYASGFGFDFVAAVAYAPQNYLREDASVLRLLERVSEDSMIALHTNDNAVVEKVAALIAVGLKAAKDALR